MNRSSLILVLAFVLGFICLFDIAFAICCGRVSDGLKKSVDIDRQTSTTTLSANFEGFEGNCLNHPSNNNNHNKNDNGHNNNNGHHNVLRDNIKAQAHKVAKDASHAVHKIDKHASHDLFNVDLNGKNNNNNNNKHHKPINNHVVYEIAFISDSLVTSAINISGNEAPVKDRCRHTSGLNKGVTPDIMDFTVIKDLKNDTYTNSSLSLTVGTRYYAILRVSDGGGDVIFSNSNGVLVEAASSTDDDDDFADWKAGLIAMGIAIYCLLLLLLLLIIVAKGKGEDKYTTTVHRNENVDKV